MLIAFWLADCLTSDAREAEFPVLHSITVREGGRVISLWLVLFDEDSFSLRAIDNALPGDAVRFFDLAGAMKSEGCVAGINASFYNRHPFDPVGLMISDGRKAGSFDRQSWMQGLLVVRGDKPSLEAADTFQPDQPGINQLIQSGPWLVRGRKAEMTNNNRLQAARTFIGHDGRGKWFLGVSDACTLAELSNVLCGKIVRAVIDVEVGLNLDGGPSTGLWMKRDPYDFYRREAGPVRNYIGLVRKGDRR